MGGGYWRKEDFERYSAGMGRKVGADGHVDTSGMRGAQDMYRASGLDPKMDPYKVMRECCDVGCHRFHGRRAFEDRCFPQRDHAEDPGRI